jgi:hypothetical protein
MTKISIEPCASCPKCFGPLRRVVEGETGQHLQWKVCAFCGAKSNAWPEHQWSEPSSEPDVTCSGTPCVLSRRPEADTELNAGQLNRSSIQSEGRLEFVSEECCERAPVATDREESVPEQLQHLDRESLLAILEPVPGVVLKPLLAGREG